jgi:hypothetical protein
MHAAVAAPDAVETIHRNLVAVAVAARIQRKTI